MSDILIPLPALPTSTGALAMYQSPHLIATYSHLPDRKIQHSDVSMSYYKGASIGDDLKAGYGSMIERDPLLDEHLDGLCESLLKYRKEGGKIKEGALITWRGMMTRYAYFETQSKRLYNILSFCIRPPIVNVDFLRLHSPIVIPGR